MKMIITSIIMLTVSLVSYSQQTEPSAVLTKQNYLQKSKSQKTVAWILAGSGVGLMVAGFATVSEKDAANYLFQVDNSGFNTSVTLFVIGGITTLSSIPFFIASGKNRRKAIAAKVSIDIKRSYGTESFAVKSSAYPALTLKLSL